MGESPKEGYSRSACTECQRRKQKCNREWPCNHCQKRKVADKCRFGGHASPDRPGESRKRQHSNDDTDSTDTNPWDDADSGFEALGYTASHLFSGLGQERRSKTTARQQRQYYMDAGSCPQLARALQVLPPRPYTDSLVQNFLNNVNYHYYIIYPPSFLDEYRNWWALRSDGRPLELHWTCLLLVVCACSAQYTDPELQQKLESDLGESIQRLTEAYHNAYRELHSVIPVGHNHLLNVQSLLHSCYWYKSEARFIECWHVLSTAIREAQELELHHETFAGHMSEFDREMRRRVWCILNAWDWQISSLLSRPLLIDRTDCDVGHPSLKLEGYSPSPLLHMRLQSEIIMRLSHRFGSIKNVASPDDVQEYRRLIDDWTYTFPPAYDLKNPDTSADAQRRWIVLHRHYLRTMTYSMMLDPFRAYLTRHMSASSPPVELSIRSDGLDYALRLVGALHGFFDHVYPRDAKFHWVLFCIFDTAAVLCSSLMHDDDGSIPRREEILGAIDDAVDKLRRLNTVTKAARTSYEVLVRVSQRVTRSPKPPVPLPSPPAILRARPQESRKLARPNAAAPSAPVTGPYPYAGAMALAPTAPMPGVMTSGPGYPVSTAHGFVPTSAPVAMGYPAYHEANPYQAVEFGDITQQDLGDLASLWDYESLDLNFIGPTLMG
ncbi:hypothetical protein JDV02_004184 [Purpureocillium takamizusanense]|uniref:Zn(2)-C6 fungal-type domain-containing protein n=1 Tax=Purpureocillium takamizusanense TaxID=2060973 RepID=A0A9Q8V953_9HYPO|nr:uncharacterized protein JDV02_004184 [Purpureocillium takamizusanense]UNI17870.1 hypothetical protein JDV02_004184 [Purpureocillium takamizusanense]